jgi:uncharacterized protein YukE
MLPHELEQYTKLHQQEIEHEVEQQRLVVSAQKHASRYNHALAQLGETLEHIGHNLQTRYSSRR